MCVDFPFHFSFYFLILLIPFLVCVFVLAIYDSLIKMERDGNLNHKNGKCGAMGEVATSKCITFDLIASRGSISILSLL